jgi:hypothetical protein
MGQTLTYELGKANIGRIVKIMPLGRRTQNSQGAMIARLVGATRSAAEVVPKGHKRPEMIEWRHIRDYTTGNRGPLNMPTIEHGQRVQQNQSAAT